MVLRKIHDTSGTCYLKALDKNFQRGQMTLMEKALSIADVRKFDDDVDTRKRKIVWGDDSGVPFPFECFAWMRSDRNLLVLGTYSDKPHGYWLLSSDKHKIEDHSYVMIHKAHDGHRFIFLDRYDIRMEASITATFHAMIPVYVPNEECAEFIPPSPMRGMKPELTRAINGNPYLASALQHAFNRRIYLRSKIDPASRNFGGALKLPVAYRSHALTSRKIGPDRYSRQGRSFTNSGTYVCEGVAAELFSYPGQSGYKRPEQVAVQPVATEKRVMRKIVLD